MYLYGVVAGNRHCASSLFVHRMQNKSLQCEHCREKSRYKQYKISAVFLMIFIYIGPETTINSKLHV